MIALGLTCAKDTFLWCSWFMLSDSVKDSWVVLKKHQMLQHQILVCDIKFTGNITSAGDSKISSKTTIAINYL